MDIDGGLTPVSMRRASAGGGYRRWLDFARVVDIAGGGYRRWSHAGLDATVRISRGWWISPVVGFRAGGGYRRWWISPVVSRRVVDIAGGWISRGWWISPLVDIAGGLTPVSMRRSGFRAGGGYRRWLDFARVVDIAGGGYRQVVDIHGGLTPVSMISFASGGCWAPAIKGGVRDIVCKWGVLGPCNQRGRARYRVQVGGAGPLQSKGAFAISCASGVCWAPAIKGGVRDIVCKWGVLGPCNQSGRARYRVYVGGAGPLQSKGACVISCASGGCWAPAIRGGVRDIVCKWGVLGPCNQRGRARYRVQVGGAGPLQSKGACAISCASGGCWAPAIIVGVRDIVCKWGDAGPLQSKGACAISCASGGCWAPAIKGGVRDIVCKWGVLGPCNQSSRARYRVQVGGAGCWAPAIKGGVRDIVCKWGVLGPCNQRARARYRVQVGGAGPLQSKGACAISCASGGCWAPAMKWGVRDIVCKWGVLGPCNQRGRARYRVQVGCAGPLRSKGACAISCAPAIKGGVRDIVCKWGCSARVHIVTSGQCRVHVHSSLCECGLLSSQYRKAISLQRGFPRNLSSLSFFSFPASPTRA